MSTDFDDVVKWTGRSWECVRDDPDESGDSQVTVREIGDLAVNSTNEYCRDQLELVDQECRDLWREMWPRRAEIEDWKEREQREREKAERAEQKRIKKMIEDEEKERRRVHQRRERAPPAF
jgi:hypothetical protein